MKTTRAFLSCAPLLTASALLFAPVTLAQYEYEPDEGVHEEEWYDPSDWFDIEDGSVDYEDMDDDDWDADDDYSFEDDRTRRRSSNQYSRSGNDSLMDGEYRSSYYDGYYDGYNDDEFGYDHWDPSWDERTKTGYTDGYYDGHYDKQQGYESEPFYYIIVAPVDRSEKTRSQRAGDEMRERGDRTRRGQYASGQGRDADARRGQQRRQADRRRQSQQRRHAAQLTDMARHRGTIDDMSSISPSAINENHTVMRLELEDGKTVRADFGPKMTKSRLPFSEGDRVTLCGDKKKHDGKAYLVVQKIRTGDREWTLRPGPNERSRSDDRAQSRDRDRQRNRDWNRNRDGDRWQDRQRSSDDERNRNRSQVNMNGTVSKMTMPEMNVDRHTIVRIRMKDGRSKLLALDSSIDADDLDVQSGDRISVRGRETKIKGHTVVQVERLSVNGERIRTTQR